VIRQAVAAIAAIALLLPAATGFAQAYGLQARVEPAQARIGDTIVYVVSVQYDRQVPPQPLPPKFDPAWGFTDPRFVGTTAMTQMNNNQVIHQVEYRFTFQATKEGTFAIPPTGFEAGGNQYRSNPVTLTVSKVDMSAVVPAELEGRVVPPQVPGGAKLQDALNGVVFVLPTYDSLNVYAGQQTLLSYHLCIDQAGLRKAGLGGESLEADQVSVPDLQQFLKDEVYPIPKKLDFKEREIGSKRYAIAPLYQVAVTPTKTGRLAIDPFQISLWFPARGARNIRDPFLGADPFNDPFFDMSPFGRRVQVVAQSPRLELNVRPLPTDGKPQDFSGAVGEFTISASLDKPKATAREDVVLLQVKIEGNGDAASLSKPALPNVAGLSLLEEPKTTTDRRKENDQLISSKTFDYALRPMAPGQIQIPPITYTVFNPQSAQYNVIQTQPLSLEVAPSANPTALVAPGTGGLQQAGGTDTPREERRTEHDDLNYIHVGALQAVQPGVLTGQGPLFVAMLAAPPLLLLVAYGIGRRRLAYRTNRGYYREVLAGNVARKHLKQAAKLLKKEDALGYFAELARAVRGYFGDKFHIDPSGLTIEQIEAEMMAREISDADMGTTRRLLEQADLVRYAPVKPDAAEMHRAYDEAAELIGRMERVR
jgi:hypothetical protein